MVQAQPSLRRQRSRALAIGMFTSVLNRGLAALTPLLVVPIGLHYLGATGYGAWATALSVTAFVGFADFGIGTGLMTRLGQLRPEHGEGDIRDAREYVASAYVMMTAVVIVGICLLGATSLLVDWASVVGAESDADGSVEAIVVATLAAFVVNLLGGLIVRVQYGVGQQGRSNLWQTAGSASTLGATWAGAALGLPPGWFVSFAAFAPVLISLLNALSFFVFSPVGRALAPRWEAFRAPVVGALARLGCRFVLISLLMTASIMIDPFIVAHTAALAEVPNFSIPMRVFSLIGTIGVMLTLPLWPLHARATSAGDVAWIRSITRRMTFGSTTAVLVVSSLAVIFGPRVLEIWLGGSVETDPLLWGGFALWWTVQTATGAAFMVQNGAEVLRPQTIGYVLLLLAIPLKWWVSAEAGYEWIPYAGSLLFVLFVWPACLSGYRMALRVAERSRVAEEVS